MIAAIYDARLTSHIRDFRTNEKVLNTYWPWGMFFNHTMEFQHHDIPLSGPDGIILEFDGHGGYTFVMDMSAQSLYKFPSITEPSIEYHKYEWWSMGQYYMLELRIDKLLDQ